MSFLCLGGASNLGQCFSENLPVTGSPGGVCACGVWGDACLKCRLQGAPDTIGISDSEGWGAGLWIISKPLRGCLFPCK